MSAESDADQFRTLLTPIAGSVDNQSYVYFIGTCLGRDTRLPVVQTLHTP
jgi:hypothetical protein